MIKYLVRMAKKKSSGWGGRRPGAGMKPLLANPRQIAVQVEAEVHATLEALAEARGESLAAYCRRVLTEHVRRRRVRA